MSSYQVHMLTNAELDEGRDAQLIADRLEEGKSSNVGDEWIIVEATSEDEAMKLAAAKYDDDWFADQADLVDE